MGSVANELGFDVAALRRAIRTKNKITFESRREGEDPSQRTVCRLGLIFFGPAWLLLGWCESREDFRNFRLDRMQHMTIKDERFRDEKGKRLKDYQA